MSSSALTSISLALTGRTASERHPVYPARAWRVLAMRFRSGHATRGMVRALRNRLTTDRRFSPRSRHRKVAASVTKHPITNRKEVMPFYTDADDEIYISRLELEIPTRVRMSINPLGGRNAIFMSPDVAEQIGNRLIELARAAREAESKVNGG